MDTVNRFKFLFIVPLAVVILYSLTYIPNKIVTVEPTMVHKIEVMDGNTGKQTTIAEREYIEYIIANLNTVKFQKGKPSFMHMGYSFRFKIYNEREKVLQDITINSDTVMRYKGFFYNATTNKIDYDFLVDLLR